jgi:hypothetical protein
VAPAGTTEAEAADFGVIVHVSEGRRWTRREGGSASSLDDRTSQRAGENDGLIPMTTTATPTRHAGAVVTIILGGDLRAPGRFDLVGSVTSTAGMIAFVYGIFNAGE